MTTQDAFEKVLARLQTLNLHLRCLRSLLQDSSEPMQQQLGKLQQAYRKLQFIWEHLRSLEAIVIRRFGRGRNLSLYRSYLILLELIGRMQRLTQALTHLTEEFLVDPVGVQACLETEIDVQVIELQKHFVQETESELNHASSQIPANSAA